MLKSSPLSSCQILAVKVKHAKCVYLIGSLHATEELGAWISLYRVCGGVCLFFYKGKLSF